MIDSNNKSPLIKTPIKVGVIGAGMVSQLAHLPAISRTLGLNLVAIADLDEALASQVARRYNVKRVYSSHTLLLDDLDIDAVVIVTHRNTTAAVVRDALLRGKNVLSEKPMAMTLPVAQELSKLASQRGLVYAVGFMKRYDFGVMRTRKLMADLLSSQRLGRLIHVRGKNFCAEYVGYCEDYLRSESRAVLPTVPISPMVPEWLDPELARKYDWFANVGLHSINLLRYLLGNALTVRHAVLHYENSASVLFDAGAVPVSFDIGRAATGHWEESFEFFFERGRLKLELTSLKQRDRCAAVTLDENIGDAKTTYWGHDTTQPWSFTRQMQAFADAVSGRGDALLASAEDSLNDMELMDNIFKIGQENKHG
ncbi:MAG: putative oxidoreductase YdgJ [Betaproteobacteria bacterium ADurb.Bin341]|nr:MAG: putative oxidoreductase YdgJ [Betaproteobacteria bacterium ADurb.Bin341]